MQTDGGKPFYRVKGFYSYMTVGGRRISVIYTADENGYKAKVIDKLSNETINSDDRLSPIIITTLLGSG